MQKVLFLETVHPILEEKLSSAGYSCEHDYQCSPEALRDKIGGYTGIVIRSRVRLDADLLTLADSLKWIARSGSGMENIDTSFAESMGIRCINSPEGNADAVGEHVIGMLLMLLNRLHTANDEVRRGLWRREENRGTEIQGKVFSVIGYGHMGSSVAAKLSGFGCKVLAHDKYKSGFSSRHIREAGLEEIFDQSDFVSLHLPLNTETQYYADQEFFSSFRKPIVFINASRGKNTDTQALANAIQTGKVTGACLDVLEYEKSSLEGLEVSGNPPALNELLGSRRVVFSPHVAGWTHESYMKLSLVLARKILGEY